ncbi:MAG: hypothetical protein WB499_11215, partial [Pseudolabrys sp.]
MALALSRQPVTSNNKFLCSSSKKFFVTRNNLNPAELSSRSMLNVRVATPERPRRRREPRRCKPKASMGEY